MIELMCPYTALFGAKFKYPYSFQNPCANYAVTKKRNLISVNCTIQNQIEEKSSINELPKLSSRPTKNKATAQHEKCQN